MWPSLLALPLVLAIRDVHDKATVLEQVTEPGSDMKMIAEVKYPGSCTWFGSQNRVLKVIVEDMNLPSRYYHKFERWFSVGGESTKKFKSESIFEFKLTDVPDSAKLVVTAYVKQESHWAVQLLGLEMCGKKSALMDFKGKNVALQTFKKDRDNFFYQFIQITLRKSQVIKRQPREAPEDVETQGREIVDEDQEPPESTQETPPTDDTEPDTPPGPDQAKSKEVDPLAGKEVSELDGELETVGGLSRDEEPDTPPGPDQAKSKEVDPLAGKEETIPESVSDLEKESDTKEDTTDTTADVDSSSEGVNDVVDTEETGTKVGVKNCDRCIMRLGLSMEGMLAWHLNDIINALCLMDDCDASCQGDWNGVTIGCSKDFEFYKTMKHGLISNIIGVVKEQKKSKSEASQEDLAAAETAEQQSKTASEEEDDGPSSADASVKAWQECQSGNKGGSWLKSQLEKIVPGKGKKKATKPQMKKWLQNYCGKQKTSDKNFKCVGLWTQLEGKVKGRGSCTFDHWLKIRTTGSWTSGCPWNRWKICEEGEKCRGTRVNWATCLATPK